MLETALCLVRPQLRAQLLCGRQEVGRLDSPPPKGWLGMQHLQLSHVITMGPWGHWLFFCKKKKKHYP